MNKQTLVVLSPVPGTERMTFDMEEVYAAENRLEDLASLTPQKAPELLSTVLKACFTLARHAQDLQHLSVLAERESRKRRAILVVDKIPDLLKAKNLSSNAENREAMIDLDDEYCMAVNKEGVINAALTLVKEKLRILDRTVGAIKAIVHDTTLVYHRPNPNLSTGPGGTNESPNGFAIGKAKV